MDIDELARLAERIYSIIHTGDLENDETELLVKALGENPEFYVPRFMYILELNKIEAKVQGPEKPAVFKKEFDEIGVIKGLYIRQPYVGLITSPKEFFTNQEVDAVLEYFGTDEGEHLMDWMLETNKLESRMMACLPDSELDKGPLFLRKVNSFGVPTGYKLTGRQNFDLLSKDFDSGKIVYIGQRHLKVL